MSRKLMTAIAGAAALGVASMGGAHAGGYEVRYSASELQSSNGAANVYAKIKNAAADYCNDRLGSESVVKYNAVRERCVADVTQELVNKVGDRRVEELHAAERI
jgi:UrcA family protein